MVLLHVFLEMYLCDYMYLLLEGQKVFKAGVAEVISRRTGKQDMIRSVQLSSVAQLCLTL